MRLSDFGLSTLDEIAAKRGVSRDTVYLWAVRGKIPSITIRGSGARGGVIVVDSKKALAYTPARRGRPKTKGD